MTDLDRRVAELRGWNQHRVKGWIDNYGTVVAGHDYSPETNLLQAFALWDEARPEGWRLSVVQYAGRPLWEVLAFHESDIVRGGISHTLADLPRAITEAWVEAREATCQQ